MFVRRLVVAVSALGLLAAGCGGGGGIQTGLRVEIEATPESGAYPLEVSLRAMVNGQPAPDDAEFDWDLGDGATSVESNPTHVFDDIGTYTVKLKIKSKGKKGAASHDIEVLEVGPGTDIAIESVEAAPAQVNPGSPVNVKVTLRNRGTSGTETAFINRVFITTTESDFDPLLEQQAGTINMSGGIAGDTSIDKELNVVLDENDFAENQYWIWVVSDATDNVDEVNETNNITRSTTKLTITSATLPVNIAVTEPTLSGTTFTPGAPVTVNTTLSNTGTAEAGAFTVKVFLSPDPTIDANDTVVYTHSVSSLAGGANDPLALMVDVPMTIINRPWYLGIIADPTGEIGETDETDNNVAYSAGLVTTSGSTGCTEDANEPNDTEAQATVLSPSMPAFKVCGATTDWFKIDLGAGDRLASAINFQNVNGNLDLAVYRMGTATALATSATSGNTESVNSGYATTAGTYLVKVTLSGTGGNTYDLTSSVEDNGGTGIDLVPTALTFGTGNGPFAQGVAHQTSVTLYNFGTMTTTTSFNVSLYLSADPTVDAGDTSLGVTNIAMLAAGGTTTDARSVTIPAGVASGYYYVIAVADSGSSNTETVETNNVFTKLIPVASGCLDDTFEPNQTVATATPMDNGTFPGLIICSGGEANGDIYAVTTGAGGTIQASIVIDGGSGTSPTDLDMRLVTAGGSEPSPCSSPNKCYSGASSVTESLTYTSVAGGTYYVKVYGYSSSKGGYTLTISGSTGSIADFTPNAITAGPADVLAGDDVQVDGKIKNNSTQMTPAFEWSVRLSTDATIDASDMTMATVSETALAANENRVISKKVTLPDNLAGGNYWFGVVADPAGMVTEGSEANNIGVAGPVHVTALCTDDGYEENDSLTGAAPIAIGGTISSLYVCSGDADFFAVTPASSGTLTIHSDFTHSATGDIDMRLYQGTTLLLSSTSVNDDEDISYAVQSGVTYKIKVYGFSSSTNPFAGNAYTLTTTLAP